MKDKFPKTLYCNNCQRETCHRQKLAAVRDGYLVCNNCETLNMMSETYKNRYGDIYTFTLDRDGNILWEGEFKWCRTGFKASTEDLIMVDPSGGPYIDLGTDMGRFNKDWEGEVVTGFVPIITGYKLTIH